MMLNRYSKGKSFPVSGNFSLRQDMDYSLLLKRGLSDSKPDRISFAG